MATRQRDLIVVGGGPAGMAAARAGARAGALTLLIQSGPIGGDCTFTGCVPSKTLLEAAARGASFVAAMEAARSAVAEIAGREGDRAFARDGVEVLHGWAGFRSPGQLEVDGSVWRSPRFILATGAVPAAPPVEGLAALDYLTNESVFELKSLPASLAVLGGGAIGCELAQAFARLGSSVAILEADERLLPREEPEASATLAEAFSAERISIRVATTVTRVEPIGTLGAARLHLSGGAAIVADKILVATGRRGAIDGLALAAAGVDTRGGFVRVDSRLATSSPGIWAAGDVTGLLPFTHAADEMGRLATRNALSGRRKRRFDPTAIPWVTFTSPEIARVGMTEAQAAEHGGRVAFVPMAEVDRAIAARETRGFVKLIAGPRPWLGDVGGGRLLGATVVAGRGGEMIGEAALAMRTRMFTGRLAQTVRAYPTWSTALRQAAAQFFMETDGRSARPALRGPSPTAVRPAPDRGSPTGRPSAGR